MTIRAVVIKRGHDPVGIEPEVFRVELIAFEEIELHLVERQLFRIENETNALAASRLRGVIQPEAHLELLIPYSFNRMMRQASRRGNLQPFYL
jgi:hypothetical protein